MVGVHRLGELVGVAAGAGGVGQGVGEVEVIKIFRMEAGGDAVMGQGFIVTLLVQEKAAQVVVGVGVVGFACDGGRQIGDGFVGSELLGVIIAQVVARHVVV